MAYPAIITTYILLLLVSILLTYALSVGWNHVSPFVPYLSFLGNHPIESTVFTQLFVIVSVVFALVAQIQYVQVRTALRRRDASPAAFALNEGSIVFAYIAASGIFVFACFQESNAYYVHHLGVIAYLFGSLLYFLLHTAVSRKQREENAGMRVVLNIFMCLTFVLYLVPYVYAVRKFEGPWEQRHHWEKGDEGWLSYIISALSEWVLIALFQIYIMTFYVDSQKVLLTKTEIIVLDVEG